MPKFDKNARKFWHSGLNSIKGTFLDSSYQYLLNDIWFVWFHGSPYFSIVFGNDVIMTSFLVTCFSNLHILWSFE